MSTDTTTPTEPAWRAQAGAARRLGDNERVVAILRAAAAAEPANIEPRGFLVNSLIETEHFDEAMEVLRACLALRPGDPVMSRSLSQMLCNAERFDEAIEVLRACLALCPGDPSLSHFLSELLYNVGDFAAALAAAAAVLKGDLEYRRSLLIRVDCLEALGRPEAGPVADEVAGLLVDEPDVRMFVELLRRHHRWDLLAAFCERWMERHGEVLQPLLELGRARFKTRRFADSLTVFHRAYRLAERDMLVSVGRFPETVPPLDRAREADILSRFEAARQGGELGRGRLGPPEYGAHGPHPLRPSARMTCLGPATISDGLPNDVMHHFVESARESGIDAEGYGDDVLFSPYGAHVTDAAVAERRQRLHAFLEARPTDLVVLDCPFFPRRRTFNADDIRQIRAARPGVRVVHFFRDSGENLRPAFDAWQSTVDAFLVLDPLSFLHRLDAVRARTLTIPQLAPSSRFFPSLGTPPMGLSFIGATNLLPRVMMLAWAMKALPDMFVVAGRARLERVATMEDYAGLLRRSRMTLNISIHGARGRIITGRVWEAVLSGSVVLDQANDCTEYFFEPYRHFVPFEDLPDLVHVVAVLSRHDDVRRNIAAAAIEWHGRHFNSARVWDSILQLAFADA